MLDRKRTAYLLFIAAYIGALIIEKPIWSGGSVLSCFSYLFTVLTHLSLFVAVILGNRWLLIPVLLEKGYFGWYALALSGLILFYTILMFHYNYFIHHGLFHDQLIQRSGGFWESFVYGMCCTVITSMLYITQKWSEQQEQVKNSHITQLQTELKYLRAQINPHFLFNGLNTVYGSIDMGNSQARNMLVQFSDLLRYNLYEADVDMIDLEKEVKYLQNYVALQKARSNDNMNVTLDVGFTSGSVKIAPLIFMAFVENGFKYVTRDDDAINRVIISLHEQKGIVEFICENTFDNEGESSPGGIGLTNATRRLDLLYKDKYILENTKIGNVYRVHLRLHL